MSERGAAARQLEPVVYTRSEPVINAAHTQLFPPGTDQREPRIVEGEHPPTDSKPKLNMQQWLFCHEFLIDLNPGAAATRSGYKSPGMGPSLLQRPEIQAGIHLANHQRLSQVRIDGAWVLQELADCYITAKQSNNLEARLKILQLCMQHLGMLQKKVHHTGQVTILGPNPSDLNLTELSDAELDQLETLSRKVWERPPIPLPSGD